MHSDQFRRVVTEQFQRSLEESKVKVSAIPPEQLNTLAEAIADSIFAAFDALEEEDVHAMSAAGPPMVNASKGRSGDGEASEEALLWHGRPYLTIGTRYQLTSERIRIIRGILGTSIEEIELFRVRDTKVNQHMGERMLNVGDVTVFSNDPTTPEVVLHNVRHPIDVRELIRKATMEEKQRRGTYYREDVGGPGA